MDSMHIQRVSEQEEDEPEVPAWLTTYSDLMCLLVTFFVMLFALLTVKEPAYRSVAGALSRSMALYDSPGQPVLRESLSNWRKKRQSKPAPSASVREPVVALQEDLPVLLEEKGAVPALDTGLFFDPGSAVIPADVRPVLDKLLAHFRKTGFKIQVQGYPDETDRAVPVAGSLDRRELAGGRALAVADYLIAGGLREDQVSVAACDGFITELAAQQRDNRKNKQVDIVVLHE